MFNPCWNPYSYYYWGYPTPNVEYTSGQPPMFLLPNEVAEKVQGSEQKRQVLNEISEIQPKNESKIAKPRIKRLRVTQESKSEQIEVENFKDLTKQDIIQLKSTYRKVGWDEAADNKLIRLVQEKGMSWIDIAKKFPNTTQKMCSTRYKRLRKNQKKYWTYQQDHIILEMVENRGERWKQISAKLQNRTPKQIREHYINLLRPQIKKQMWTPEQDMKLAKLVDKHGHKWRLFEEYLSGRTQNHIKNRFYGRIRKIKMAKIRREMAQSEEEVASSIRIKAQS